MEEATMKINDIDINKYKTHDVINSLKHLYQVGYYKHCT